MYLISAVLDYKTLNLLCTDTQNFNLENSVNYAILRIAVHAYAVSIRDLKISVM